MGFDPCNCFLKIWKSIRIPTPKVGVPLGVWGFILSHSPTLLGAWNVILGLPSWPETLQAFAMFASPTLGLRHFWSHFFFVVIFFKSSLFHVFPSCDLSQKFFHALFVSYDIFQKFFFSWYFLFAISLKSSLFYSFYFNTSFSLMLFFSQNLFFSCSFFLTFSVATPLWVKCEDEIHTPKSGNLESFGTLKNSELDCRG